MTLIVDGTTGVTFNDSSLQGAAASPYVLKNRIINGDMVIDQRNAGASVSLVTAGGYGYPADRWYAQNQTSGTATVQQVSDAPTGYSNSIKYTVSSVASSIISTDSAFFQQAIEGFNTADLLFGTSNVKTITISFWVKSSITGTFGGALANSAYDRGYSFSFTISSANTWEQKTVTITGDTTGTWIGATNGLGLRVSIAMAAGSARSSTNGVWGSFVGIGVSGQTNLMATNGATFQLTGVQLEIGTSATPFERRLYNQELANCQRYYYQISKLNWAVSSSSNGDSIVASIPFPVTMRSDPTLTNDYVNGVYDSAGPAAGKWCFNKPYVSNSTKTGTITAGATLLTYGAEVYYYGATFSPAPTGFNTPDTTLAMKFSAEL